MRGDGVEGEGKSLWEDTKVVGLFGELLVDARLEKLEVNRTSVGLGSISMLSVWELTEVKRRSLGKF